MEDQWGSEPWAWGGTGMGYTPGQLNPLATSAPVPKVGTPDFVGPVQPKKDIWGDILKSYMTQWAKDSSSGGAGPRGPEVNGSAVQSLQNLGSTMQQKNQQNMQGLSQIGSAAGWEG